MSPRLLIKFAAMALMVLPAPFFGGCAALGQRSKESSGKSEKKGDLASPQSAPWNGAVIAAIEKLPLGGGYAVGAEARDALQAAVAWEEGKPVIRPKAAQPSFCSGATYLAFVVMLAQEQRAGRLALQPEVWRKLIVEGQVDGEGVWGAWNANGPGTARLFHKLGLGRNFTDWKSAQPGDFLKVFWNDSIGVNEKGHSVIYLAHGNEDGQETVTYWSSNQSGGYGVKQVPVSKIHRFVLSRLEHPERLSEVLKMPQKDAFLFKLQEEAVSPMSAASAIGLSSW